MKRVAGILMTAALACTAVAATYLSTINDYVTDYGLTSYYGQTSWPTGHRDSRNSGFVPLVTPASLNPAAKWTALDNATVLAAVTVGPEGHLYATTGKEAGQPNLFAFNRDGQTLWSSNLPDSGAVASSAVVDSQGDLYLSDSDQLWAFHADGSVKWVAPISHSFITAIITANGFVGGVSGNGDVFLFHRSTGALASNVFSLPAGVPLAAQAPPTGVWQGLMDPARIPSIFAGLVGTGAAVVNTAAVNPVNNRMFITAAGPVVNGKPTGRLYGMDISAEGQLSLAFSGAMGPGSGTSPVISADGTTVYAVDAIGNMYAFDARSTAASAPPAWVLSVGTSVAAPSVGPDGTLYSLGSGKIVAIAPNGVKKWEQNFDAAAQALPIISESAAPRKSQANSVISVTSNRVYVTANLGYLLTLSDGSKFLLPSRSALFALDPQTGALLASPLSLRDVGEGFITMAADGSAYVTHGATISSIAVNAVLPSLPAGPIRTALTQLALKPIGGVSAFNPASFRELAQAGLEQAMKLDGAAAAGLSAGSETDIDNAYTAVRGAVVQLKAAVGSISDARSHGELDDASAVLAQQAVQTAQTLLDNARNLIAKARTEANPGLLVAGGRLIENANRMLDRALSNLELPMQPFR